MKTVKTIVSVFLVLAMWPLAVLAEGTIAGKVTDGETGDGLRGATVQVLNTKKGAYTDTKGTFRIKKMSAGTYTVKIAFVGYDSKTVEGVVVKDDETTQVDMLLEMTKTTSKEVVVSATRSNDNAAALLAKRKNASQVSDGIGKEEISKLPDGDAGQSLKRVSGVTLVEGKYVFVRGVSDRYSNTTLNGASLSTTEPDKKSFAFDMFPAELLENANIAKSFTPDLPGNFAGGLVQLNTIDFPSSYNLKFSAGQQYNDNVTFRGNEFLTYQGGNTDWLAFSGQSRVAPSDVPASRQEFAELNKSAYSGNQASIDRVHEVGTGFQNTRWNTRYETAPTNGNMGLTLSAPIEVGDSDQLGIVANMNYGTSFAMNRMKRGGIQSDGTLQYDKQGYAAQKSVSWGGLLNLAYRMGTNTTFSLKNVYNRGMDDESVELDGLSNALTMVRREFGFNYVERQLASTQLSGEHTVTDFSNALIEWKLGYSASLRNEPDYRRLTYQRNVQEPEGALTLAITASPYGDGTSAGRFYSNMTEFSRNANLNFTIPVNEFKIKVGGLYEFRNRNFSARSYTMVQSQNYQGDIDNLLTINETGQVDHSRTFQDSNFTVNRILMSEETKASDSYIASEELGAGYAMADLPFTLGTTTIRFIGGARIEKSIQQLNSFDYNNQAVNPRVDVADVLPSINLVIGPTVDMNVRMSATQTLSRPSLREFAPFSFYNFQTQAVVTGNPNLTRALIQNYDLRWEYFPASGEVLSASLFYKTFKNAIEETIFPSTSEVIFSFQNASGLATNIGVELEARKNLGFIGDFFKSFTFAVNYAYIKSNITVTQGSVVDERPMWGQSPYTFNASLFYTNIESGSTINFGYNTYGKRIIKVGQRGVYQFDDPHVYEMPRDVIDFGFTQSIGSSLEFKFSVRDLLNQALIWQQGATAIQSNIRGRSFTFGIGYKLQ